MKAICLMEIRSFLSSLTGYLVIIVFLLINGLMLWFFDGTYNILQSNFADLAPFFYLAPLVLTFLIPAVSMKSLSEEIKQGTIELLLTKPLSVWQIVLGKYFGILFLIFLSILPTVIYVYFLESYLLPGQEFDMGSVLGSYFGLLFLSAAYGAMGIFASALSENQIVSFILGVGLCLFFSLGIDALAGLMQSTFVEKFGVQYHFRSISRGVIDTRDLIYFVSIAFLFLSMTVSKIKTLRK
ncbi:MULTISPECIES: gliding motility-associated ABC transporter permease subunit GldF [Myroides]|uniref:Gliding motility-associated ABC transporter permease subunit GldF n=1 Tax=Myroides albus TaxID=2562892 RepID=A0A6I3LNR6_9FLAO|nr:MULTISPECIES: gliding motility-associated ABC transporter permease subunit GldF [Myroides]MTG97822.1 gliding motility-associated ABC transporter permease subunit GldF [Myroides albus]MVX37236.1 gliding motility-associated ABC transporter permease subunit GldF [Myroides sp. LoEW2-1]